MYKKKNPVFPKASKDRTEIEMLIALIDESEDDFKASVREDFDQRVAEGDYEEDDWEDFFEREEREAQETGRPRECYSSHRPYSPDEWIFHFTDADPYDVAKGFNRGVELLNAGYSHTSPRGGSLVFGFPCDSTRLGKYGENLVMFKANSAIKAYHSGDEEYQAIADRYTVTQTIAFGGTASYGYGQHKYTTITADTANFLYSGLLHPKATEPMVQAAIFLHGTEFDGVSATFDTHYGGATTSDLGAFVDAVLETLSDKKNHRALEILGGEWCLGDPDEIVWRTAGERELAEHVLVREGRTIAIPQIPPADLHTGRLGLQAAKDRGATAVYRKAEDMIVIFYGGLFIEQ